MRAKIHSPIDRVRISALIVAGSILSLSGFESVSAQEHDAGVEQTIATSTQSALKDILVSHRSDSSAPSGQRDALEVLYRNRDFQPIWTESAEAIQAGIQVRDVLMRADRQGLDAAAYAVPALQTDAAPAPGRDAARYDIALTEALLRYARDVRVGRVHPKAVYKDVGLPSPNYEAAAALASALSNGSADTFLGALPPAHLGYRRLAEGLSRYQAIAAEGGWKTVSSASESDLKALGSRLAMEDSQLAKDRDHSAAELQEAIKRYQQRNGLRADGKLGPETVAALNVPVSARIQQIVANMERWRWMPSQFENRYIAINVPDQSLDFIQDGKVLLTSRVIVGRKTSRTPILRTETRSLVANPPWNVPSDIADNQILPHLKGDPNYLAKHNMVMTEGRIMQRPGPGSAMGILMLDLPNDFDVYLHDTPGKKPFGDDQREVSNGCIRVQQIMPLASLALTNDMSAGLGQINNAIASHETRRIALGELLPIYMLYWTAIGDADGNVGFRPDRYERDPPLIAALAKTVIATRS